MSIAIRIHLPYAHSQPKARTLAAERVPPSPAEQMREARRLMRHFALAFVTAGTGLYAAAAAGLTF